MKLKDLIKIGVKTVAVISYGYEEQSFFNNHFEPFKKARVFHFEVDPMGYCYHKWLNFENENDETFVKGENYESYGVKPDEWVCFDPDLWARP